MTRGLPLDVVVDAPRGRPRIGHDVADALVDASREALRNVVRHTGCTTARWTVRHADDHVVITIGDDGPGLGPDSRPGFGLRWSIVDRLEGVGGQAQVDSDGSGTDVVLTVARHAPRPHLALADSFDRTLRLPGTRRARTLALGVATPPAVVNSWVGLRNGLLDDGHGIQLACWLLVLASTWWFASRIDRGAPAPATFVGLVTATAGALAVALGTTGPGALLTFESWMIGGCTIPLILLAYVTPIPLAPLYVLPNLAVVAAVAAQDPTVGPVSAVAALTTPLIPVMAGVVGHLQRRAGTRIDREFARLRRETFAKKSTEDARDALLDGLLTTAAQAADRFGAVARGDLDTERADVRADLIALASSVRDELYVPGLFDDDLRLAVQRHRRAGGGLTIRADDELRPSPRLSALLRLVLAEATGASSITVSRHDGAATRVVVTPGADHEVLRQLEDTQISSASDDALTVIDLPDVGTRS